MGAIPKMMRAAALDRFGGPEVLTLHTLPVPTLDPNEVLVAVDIAGVGSWDADMRERDGHPMAANDHFRSSLERTDPARFPREDRECTG